ncbi:MAG: CDP-diacylglycerol--serine O-phosphatidyltransferase [Pelagibacteraceae bacterium TMED124]|nr:MAG: CDP-diacylglycerol--serine O-phosphatidyltransferase [Pelagibacteraceae bacterium TMED124]
MEKKNQFKIVSVNKSRYILPNVLTLIGVCLGISSIKFAMDGNFSYAVLFLIVAAILDALDGRVARLIKGTSDFGKELDSLTDFVSFGIAPAFIIYFWELNKLGKIGWLIVLLFSVCCVLRLARFNLTKFEKNDEWKNNFFQGVPSPAGGCLILLPLIFQLSGFSSFIDLTSITPYFMVLISFLLISKIPTFSFKKIAIRRNMTIFLLLGVGLFFVSIIQFTFETLTVCILIYLFLIPIGIYNFRSKSKNANQIEIEDEQQDIL